MTLTKEAALEWLSLVESSGIYLAPKVLEAAFPQSLDSVDTAKRQRLRSAWDEWREAVDGCDPQLTDLHHEWVRMVLTELLEYRDTLLRPVGSDDQVWTQTTFDTGTLVRPDWVLRTGQDQPKVAVFVYPPDRSLDRAGKGAASPIEQVTAWCRAKGVRNALLTDGERWTLVDAPEGAVSGSVTWYARLWWLESVTLRAFFSLLRARNLFGRQESTFAHLVDASQEYRDEVTTTLGEQVERAVEALIRALDRANHYKGEKLLEGVGERELYEAGLTVMMRLVFVLSAEERGLLLLGDPVWDANYAVSTLRSQLEEIDDRDGHGVLALRYDAWSRLLAVFRAVYGGIEHESLRLPALGGSLFDPDRFPFLEGRSVGTTWRDTAAEPLPIDNRTVLLLLSALQKLSRRDGAQTLSYRALDVEQIGHVYEGLLERTVARVDDVTLGLKGAGKIRTPDIRLSELESARFDGIERLTEVLKKAGMSEATVRRALAGEVPLELRRALTQACEGDQELDAAVLPFANLLRTDPWDEPVVYRKGGFAVTSGSDRSNTGAHYTPKALTERIVGTTLEPVVYVGPAEGLPREEWRLKSAAELLDLKICDPAMGSGAFLVQTCRWLGEKVVQAWANAENQGESVTAGGEVLPSLADHDPLAADPEERLTLARRLVAERCLYGVDINPVAVELAKLSIWLVTLAKNRPFGFLDHNLRHGDSLLGIHDLNQLSALSMTPKPGDQQYIFATNIREAVDEAVKLRQRLRSIPIRDIRDVQQMAKLDDQARRLLARPELAADALIGEAMRHAGRPGDMSVALRVASTEIGKMLGGNVEGEKAVAKRAREALAVDLPSGKNPRKPLHWPLEFPEVFKRENGGFDAFVGNPPFLGGVMISAIYGDAYNQHLADVFETGKKVDLSAFFIRNLHLLSRRSATLGLIATNSISQGTTRKGGLDKIVDSGCEIFSAIPSFEWPGNASVIVAILHFYNGAWSAKRLLEGKLVASINSELLDSSENTKPVPLVDNDSLCYQGSNFYGKGFFVENDLAEEMIKDEPSNSEVVIPVMGGAELNNMIDFRVERYAINFKEMDKDSAIKYRMPFSYIDRTVRMERQELNAEKYPRLVETWWKYWHSRLGLYAGIEQRSLTKVLARSRVSDHHMVEFLPSNLVYTDALVVFLFDNFSDFGILQSTIHDIWSRKYSSTMKNDVRYVVSDCFGTFPRPDHSDLLESESIKYYNERTRLKHDLSVGMTRIYNMFHNPIHEVGDMRLLRRKLDRAVLDCYGWGDIKPTYDFFSTPRGVRYTIDDESREKILRRLLLLNSTLSRDLVTSKVSKKRKTERSTVLGHSLFDPAPAMGHVPEKPKQAVLEVLRRGNRWFKKAEVLRESGITERDWNLVIAGLLEDGLVERRGEKRGTEYMLRR